MDADVAVETATDDAGTPPVVDSESAESGTPPVDAQAEAPEAGSDPASGGEDEPEEWRKFLDKFKGDKAAAGKAWWEKNNYASQVTKERDELKARITELEQRATQPTEPPEPEAIPEDLQKLDTYISSLKTKVEALPQKESELVKEIWSLNRDIAKAEARLEDADDLDKPKRELELAKLQARQADRQQQLDAIPEIRERYETDLYRADRDRKAAEAFIQAEERARQEAGEKQTQWETSLVSEVNTLIPRIADELKLLSDPKDASIRSAMAEDVYEGLMADLWARANANIKEVNIQELIRARVEKWGKKHGLIQAAKLAQLSKEKTSVAGKPNGTPAKTAPAPTTVKPLSIHEQVERERAARIAKMAKLGL